MEAEPAAFALDAEVAFRGAAMRVIGRLLLESASGQRSYRYLLSDGGGAPVLVEQAGDGRGTLLRPFPAAAEPLTAGNTVTVGRERYTLVGVRKLTPGEALGQIASPAARADLLLSGMFEGPAGTLMRELIPGTNRQVYYLVKPLAAGDLVSAAAYAARREAEVRAAAAREDD
jgi:hypothetical protein